MERQKQGKVERFVKNRVARATAAVALTFAAGAAIEKSTGYEVFPNVQTVEADGPNLLPNPAFELQSSGLPQGYVEFNPPMGADYQFQTGTPHSPMSYVSGDIYGAGCPDFGINGWITNTDVNNVVGGIPVDLDKNYRINLWARSDNLNPGAGLAEPSIYLEYYDVNGAQIPSIGNKNFSLANTGEWESFTATIGLSGDLVPPVGTEKIKVAFSSNNTTPPTDCADNTLYSRVSFDDVSLVQVIPASVGGIAEAPDFGAFPAISDSKKDSDSKLPLAAGAAAALAITAGGAAVYVHKRRKTS